MLMRGYCAFLAAAALSLSAAAGGAATMRGYAATSANCASQGYSEALRAPALGDLRARYSGLPEGACEVLVVVACSSVNPSDLHPTVAAAAGLPHVMGSDVAGTVVRAAPGCDRVRLSSCFYLLRLSCFYLLVKCLFFV
jgi:hypothetical protein